MDAKLLGALAAVVAALAVALCMLTVVLSMPLPVEAGLLVVALIFLAGAGALIRVAVDVRRMG